MPMKVTIKPDAFINVTRQKLVKRLDKAGIFLTNKIKEKISQGQPYRRYGQKAIWYRGLSPSAPGQPPKVITGQLRASITYEVTPELVLRIGSNLPYAMPLEVGSRFMQARPYLRSTVIEQGDKIKSILAGG